MGVGGEQSRRRRRQLQAAQSANQASGPRTPAVGNWKRPTSPAGVVSLGSARLGSARAMGKKGEGQAAAGRGVRALSWPRLRLSGCGGARLGPARVPPPPPAGPLQAAGVGGASSCRASCTVLGRRRQRSAKADQRALLLC